MAGAVQGADVGGCRGVQKYVLRDEAWAGSQRFIR
jgi:hypothetical protein